MKNETSPTCPICSAPMEESKRRKIAVDHICLVCGFTTDVDIMQSLREEAIINGEIEEDHV